MGLNKLIIVMSLILSNSTFVNAQDVRAMKPKLIIVPSDNWCKNNKFITVFDNQGIKKQIPDYRTALVENSQISLVISKLEELFQERNFAPVNLERALKSVENEIIEEQLRESKDSGSSLAESPIDMFKKTAKADILIQVGYTINLRGPQKSVTYLLRGFDSYTDKAVANASGVSDWSSTFSVTELLQRSVVNKMDGFLNQLQVHFNDMFKNGREVKISLRRWSDWEYDMESYFGDNDEEIGLLIEDWIFENTVNGKFSTADYTENMINFEQVRIPLFTERNGRKRPLNTRTFGYNLSRYLKSKFGIESKVSTKGLGEATLILGSK